VLSMRGAAAAAAVIALVKARYVAMDFMELRGTAVARYADAWFAIVGVVCLVLILR
jgi:hypothetical protein